MMKLYQTLLAASALLVHNDAANTLIAVINVGNGAAVRRTLSVKPETTVEGVASFWSALHTASLELQEADMTVVPDLFRKASSGITIGLTGGEKGVDLEYLPIISSFVSEEGKNGVVGHMKLEGSRCENLLKKIDNVEVVDALSLLSSGVKHAAQFGLSGLKVMVDSDNASKVDNQIAELIKTLEGEIAADNLVIHLIVEDGEASTPRSISRRLEENEGGNANGNQNNGYYGYGYYNAYGEYVTPYKSMFQIQYFNVVLWTAIGLAIVLFYTIYIMINMPLMPDTLLFGESAKLVGED